MLVIRPGLILRGFDSGKPGKRRAFRITANIADFSNKLRSKCLAYAVHSKNSFVFWKFRCEFTHLGLNSSNSLAKVIKLTDCLSNECFSKIVIRQSRQTVKRGGVHLFGFLSTEIIPVFAAPLLIFSRKTLS